MELSPAQRKLVFAVIVLALAGLTLLALSLVGVQTSDRRPAIVGVVIWLAACGGGAVLIIATPTRFARAASLGLATGLLFADGGLPAKLVRYGGAGRRASSARATRAAAAPTTGRRCHSVR